MEYVLSYVDDCLVVSQHLEEVLGRLGKYFPLKPGAVDPDKLYCQATIILTVMKHLNVILRLLGYMHH